MSGFIPDAPDLATEVADLLHHANHTIRRQAVAGAGSGDVTSSQMRAMRVLIRRVGPMRMSELAEELGIVRRSATSVVDDLEQLGMVERTADPVDRRAVGVQLTRSGRALLDDARRRRRNAAGRVLESFSEPDLRKLRDLLQRITDTGT
ncbi:MAG: MarR family transcriptional regulator [Ilumatobacteraceae bacterium]